jgi:hypothetical protein
MAEPEINNNVGVTNNSATTQYLEDVVSSIELGTKYTSKITLSNGFVFEVHMPSVQEEMLIYPRMKEIMAGMNINSVMDEEMQLLIRSIATLDIVINGIETFTIESGVRQYNKVKKSFWEWVSQFRNPTLLYSKVVIPLYTEYLKFYRSIDISLDDLKKN